MYKRHDWLFTRGADGGGSDDSSSDESSSDSEQEQQQGAVGGRLIARGSHGSDCG